MTSRWLLLWLFSPLVLAVESGEKITVSADQVKADQNNKISHFTGQVVVQTSEKRKAWADAITIKEDKNGRQEMDMTGKPAKFIQEAYKKNEPFEGSAERIEYRGDTVIMTGQAWAKRGEDESTAHQLIYNTKNKTFEGYSGMTGTQKEKRRVKIIFNKKDD